MIQINKRTVFLLVAIAIVISSAATMFVMGADLPVASMQEKKYSEQEFQQALNRALEEARSLEASLSSVIAGENGEIPPELLEKFAKVLEAYQIVRSHSIYDVDDVKLIEGAIEGILNALEDPYSAYMDPQASEQFMQSLSSSFEGIGAEVTMRDGYVTIVSPIRNSPAEKAGLRPDDRILSVDSESIEGLDVNQAVMKIRGPKGTQVVLEILRPGVENAFKVTIIRDEIPLQTVYTKTFKANDKTIGKIDITSFGLNTAQDFQKGLKELEGQKIDALVIDVRKNPGGVLTAVDEIGKLLIPNKGLITKIESRQGIIQEYRSAMEQPKPYPITILVDNGSASASEILAASMQAAGYKVVGQTTFGKGTVQTTVKMEDDSHIKITFAKWLTPTNEWINGVGVTPDVEVRQPDFFDATPIGQLDLSRGMVGNEVANLQVILKGVGFDPGRDDGNFDTATEQALKTFQSKNGLPATGAVDEATASELINQLIEEMRDPENDVQLQRAVEVLLKEM